MEMQKLVNNQETLTSMEVAQMVGKEYKALLRDIRIYQSIRRAQNCAVLISLRNLHKCCV